MKDYLEKALERAENPKSVKEMEIDLKRTKRTSAILQTIKGSCWTNLSVYKDEVWPRTFFSVPQRGDRIESANKKRLFVLRVNHGEDSILIELGLKKEVEDETR